MTLRPTPLPVRTRRGSRPARRWRVVRATLLLVGATLTSAAFLPTVSRADTTPSLAGSAGVNPIPSDTSSKVTVNGRGAFSNLAIHLTQTADLTNQTIGVTWTGGVPTTSTNGTATDPFTGEFDKNWLAIFQCWGDPSATDPLTAVNPGPEPTQCEQGADALNGSRAYPQGNLSSSVPAATRIIAFPGDPDYAAYQAAGGVPDPATGVLFEPFKSVDGTTVDISQNEQALANPNLPFWQNPYFSYNNTNEVPFARTFPNGSGSTLFTTDTGLEAPGLGCGQTVQPLPGGSTKVPQCWLVVVPVSGQAVSPASPAAWANRISIPLSFRNVDSPCAFGKSEQRIEGNELALSAVSSWQPTLCATPGLVPYNYTVLGDGTARSDLPNQTSGGAQLAVVTKPLDPTTLPAGSKAVYAPLTLSALTIGFNIERYPALDPQTGNPLAAEDPYATTRVATINLTPRLVAKLLTESYLDALPGVKTTGKYAWAARNPIDLFADPDFIQFNPEFSLLTSAFDINTSQLEVEFNSEDANAALWQWIYSDKEAAAWLAGAPDQFGMEVNPYYSTNPVINTTGTAFDPAALSNFPLSDPYCQAITPITIGGEAVQAPCVLSWDPYANNVNDAAAKTASTNTGSTLTPNPNAQFANQYFVGDGAQTEGRRVILSVIDSVSAAKYGLQTASLSQDNQDTSTRSFIGATPSSILAGEASMRPDPAASTVLDPNPTTTASGAYPLSLLSYAAAIPATMTAKDRSAYTPFITYGSGAGQVQGTAFGQLPPGYVPLPSALAAQAKAAIGAIDTAPLPGSQTPSPPATTPPTTAPSTATTVPVTTPATLPAAATPSATSPSSTPATTPPASTATPPATTPVSTTPTTAAPPLRQVLASSPTPATSVGVTRWAVVALAVLILAAGLVAMGRRPLALAQALQQSLRRKR